MADLAGTKNFIFDIAVPEGQQESLLAEIHDLLTKRSCSFVAAEFDISDISHLGDTPVGEVDAVDCEVIAANQDIVLEFDSSEGDW
jgi:hypothetical protein